MPHQLRLFFIALQFLTRVPVPRAVGFQAAWLNRSARYFPLVGLCVGALAAVVFCAGSAAFAPGVAALLSIAASVVATGAFHEDGLADTFDALGGAVDRERALEIMKDSRIGSYGALALVIVVGAKAAALASMPPAMAWPVILLAHTASRAAAVALIRALPYAGDPARAKAKPLAERVSASDTATALVTVLLLLLALGAAAPDRWPSALGTLVAMMLGTWAMGRWLKLRLGGITGDGLGATQQITELLGLLGWLAAARWAG